MDMMNAKEKRAMQLEIHRMNRTQSEFITRNAALESECARLAEKLTVTEREMAAALQREMDTRGAMQLEIHRMNRLQSEVAAKNAELETECARLSERLSATEREMAKRGGEDRENPNDAMQHISESVAANYAHVQLICNRGFEDKRVLLFSHYSKREEVESHNYLTLEQLDDRFDVIVILTNCPNAWEPKRPNYNKYHILSYNFKSDFRNYGVFIAQTEQTLLSVSQLCLMNDSFVVVDVTAFNRCMAHVFESAADFAGITSSHEGVFHLQSYFLLFNKPAVRSIVAYFKTRGLPMNHGASISEYELGITTQLMQEGLTPFAMVSNQEMPQPLNTTCFKWSAVLQQTGIVKRQHFFKQYPPWFAMTPRHIALVAEKYSRNVHFIHFLKYHGVAH